ncbi:MAG: hypothetical protein QOF29_2987 [bacterium]|jgi:hypothetical protein
MRRTAVACALVVIAVPAGGASPAVAAERYTIRVSGSSISSIGDLRGRFTLGAAIRQFGRPASLTPTGFSCRLEWRRLRLRAEFGDCEEGERVPIVRAIVSGGRVRALGLFVGAAGE